MSKEQDNKTTLIAVAAAVIIAVVGVGTAVYALTLESNDNKESKELAVHVHADGEEHDHSEAGKKSAAVASDEQQADLVIVYEDGGFANSTYTVTEGETVLVKNESSVDFYFTTGSHENHDINSPLNLGTITPGKASSFVAPAAGTYGFHNHDNDAQAGELIVQ